MPIYTEDTSKSVVGHPDRVKTAVWGDLEPLITPSRLREQHLFGVSLVSRMKDPITGKRQVMQDPVIKDIIERAVSQAQEDTRVSIAPVQHTEKHPFDGNLYRQMGYLQLNYRPVTSIEKFAITPASEDDLYIFPLQWLDTANLDLGQLNILPFGYGVSATGTTVPVSGNGGAPFMHVLGYPNWIPAFFRIEYTCGFKDFMIPRIFNELIAAYACLEILQMLAATNAEAQSWSLGLDGMSQSISGPGGELFGQRIKHLEEKRDKLVGKIKGRFGQKLFAGNV